MWYFGASSHGEGHHHQLQVGGDSFGLKTATSDARRKKGKNISHFPNYRFFPQYEKTIIFGFVISIINRRLEFRFHFQ
jgi:hypothetical protein